MKPFAIIVVLFVLAAGFYLNHLGYSDKDSQVMIQDEVGSSMAAPAKPQIPL